MDDRRIFFERLVFRGLGNRRYTQDSPVMPDVWLAYGLDPLKRHDLLLSPHADSTADELARRLRTRLRKEPETAGAERRATTWEPSDSEIAFHETAVVARLRFHEMVRVALPMSAWWRDFLLLGEGRESAQLFLEDPKEFERLLRGAFEAVSTAGSPGGSESTSFERWQREDEKKRRRFSPDLVWLAKIGGTLALVARDHRARLEKAKGKPVDWLDEAALVELAADPGRVAGELVGLIEGVQGPDWEQPPPLWSINRNRPATESIFRSGNAVKADAARQLFDVRGRRIRWAVIDSGIDARHPAFRRRDGEGKLLGRGDFETTAGDGAFVFDPEWKEWKNQTRIKATYDFRQLRKLLSTDPTRLDELPALAKARMEFLKQLRQDDPEAGNVETEVKTALSWGTRIDWAVIGELLRVPHDDGYVEPPGDHGSHVAGILGADWRSGEHRLRRREIDRVGVAPEIEIYDLRGLGGEQGGDEYTVMAAMQFVAYLNRRKSAAGQMEIHGVNLSLEIPHAVTNYACGRTPVCDEAERLVGSGVVVVAAAGNRGRAQFMDPRAGVDEGYRSISITDPGNAEAVITVGATHRNRPHNYGVSYFSSRGPTGDGRRKPDLVAPGEKIYSTVPDGQEKPLDGTSQAAPHVSGAAALLMERHAELVGQPHRIKRILCESATDLGREPYFQGAGMLDILRALQSV